MRENLIEEKHSGGLSGHFGQDKTFAQVSTLYFWPGMQHDVKKFVEKVGYVNMTNGGDKILDYINPYLFQLGLGITSVWILSWDFL